MITDRELEKYANGHYKAPCPGAVQEMASDLLAYRKAARRLLAGTEDVPRPYTRQDALDRLTALGQEMGDYE
jgi:hypothetical protein